ncbi:MAG TPA: nitrile hydratase subunit beta [Caulobacteraceae bacterium]|nr:nitrile hydratase subunit beta [Caulobacteraceae bacterium]
MNGVHDMGGMHGLGAVAPEAGEPVFHAEWERRVHALVIAAPTRGNIDAGRHQRELIPGADYLRMTYYERWLAGLTAMLVQGGAVTEQELAAGRADPASPKATPRLAPEAVAPALSHGGSYIREPAPAPMFQPGDAVRACNLHPAGHTRLPRYVRGRLGVVETRRGAHVFPDSHAHGLGEDPRPLYAVRFAARELWGEIASEHDSVSLDLWEPYLERA